jgi:phosphopantothenoylcysteine decarboxylase/phosphopantothenate--cysteine ligase
MKSKHIVIGVTGSIAAYKAAELTSRLKQKGADVFVVMTENATKLIGPATFRALTGNPVVCKMFAEEDLYHSIPHVNLADWMDVLAIVPATANIIGKIAHGIADDALSTLAISTDKPIVIAPAMNNKMWEQKVVQENSNILSKRCCHIIEPETGFLACGYTGKGRLADLDTIIKKIDKLL